MTDDDLTEEEIRILLEENSRNFKRNSKLRLLKSLINSMMALLGIMILTLALILIFKNQNLSIDDKYFNKTIKTNIEKVIQANANLDVVKNIYSNRKVYIPSLTDLFNKDSDLTKYQSETPLSVILKDMRTDYFLNEKSDTTYLKKLDIIIETHEVINPFDKLEQNQKNDFENLRFKLGENYPSVSADVNRITDELHNKNQLVAEYLNKSNISFLISIVALGITIILSFYQIYQNRKERLIEILSEILNIKTNKAEKKEEK